MSPETLERLRGYWSEAEALNRPSTVCKAVSRMLTILDVLLDEEEIRYPDKVRQNGNIPPPPPTPRPFTSWRG